MHPPSLFIVQRSPRDLPGVIEDLPMRQRLHRVDLDPEIPPLGDAAGLILLGGPGDPGEETPAQQAELRLIEQAVEANIPILGICFGAQLLALAYGGRSFAMPEPEIGWLPVTLTPEGQEDPLLAGVPKVFTPKSKHWFTYKLPAEGVRLASSEQCEEQAFRIGDRAWGLQFHLEKRVEPPAGGWRQIDGVTPKIDTETYQGFTTLHPIRTRILLNFVEAIHRLRT